MFLIYWMFQAFWVFAITLPIIFVNSSDSSSNYFSAGDYVAIIGFSLGVILGKPAHIISSCYPVIFHNFDLWFNLIFSFLLQCSCFWSAHGCFDRGNCWHSKSLLGEKGKTRFLLPNWTLEVLTPSQLLWWNITMVVCLGFFVWEWKWNWWCTMVGWNNFTTFHHANTTQHSWYRCIQCEWEKLKKILWQLPWWLFWV